MNPGSTDFAESTDTEVRPYSRTLTHAVKQQHPRHQCNPWFNFFPVRRLNMNRLCLLLLPLLFAGCSTDTDPEDQRFFNRGWLNPHRDIDRDPNFPDMNKPSPMPKQAHPEKYKEDPIVG